MSNVIALDVGHSAVKLAFRNTAGAVVKHLIPSAVFRFLPITDEAERRRAEKEVVELDGQKFFVGQTAIVQGGQEALIGLSENWIDTIEHRALIKGAFNFLRNQNALSEGDCVVMGLPTHLCSRQKDELANIVHRIDATLQVLVYAQPLGPFMSVMLNENGAPNQGRSLSKDSWAVIDVGHFTTDFMLAERGRWKERSSGYCPGFSNAIDTLIRTVSENHKLTMSTVEAAHVFASGDYSIMDFGKKKSIEKEAREAIDQLVSLIIDRASAMFESHVRSLNGVVIAGGGATAVYQRLKEIWGHSVLVSDHRFAVAEGLRRYGITMSSLQRKATAAAV